MLCPTYIIWNFLYLEGDMQRTGFTLRVHLVHKATYLFILIYPLIIRHVLCVIDIDDPSVT